MLILVYLKIRWYCILSPLISENVSNMNSINSSEIPKINVSVPFQVVYEMDEFEIRCFKGCIIDPVNFLKTVFHTESTNDKSLLSYAEI